MPIHEKISLRVNIASRPACVVRLSKRPYRITQRVREDVDECLPQIAGDAVAEGEEYHLRCLRRAQAAGDLVVIAVAAGQLAVKVARIEARIDGAQQPGQRQHRKQQERHFGCSLRCSVDADR